MNLINELTNKFGKEIVNGLSLNLGAATDSVEKSVQGTLPALLGGLINKVQSKKGAEELYNLLNKKEYDGGLLNKIGNLFSGSESINLLKNGLDVLPTVLGGQSKMGTILSIAGGLFGGGLSRSQSVFGMLAPVLLNFIGKKIRTGKLNQKGLVDLLLGQKDFVQKNTHKDIAKEMGFANWASGQASASNDLDDTFEVETEQSASASSGRRFPTWLIPFGVVLGAIAALFLLTKACGEIPEEKRKAMEAKKAQQENRTQQASKKVESNQQLNTLQNKQTKPANTQKPPIKQNTNTGRPNNQNRPNNQANQNINKTTNKPNAANSQQQPNGGRKGIQNQPNRNNINKQQTQTPQTTQTSQTTNKQQTKPVRQNTTATKPTLPGTSNTATTPPVKNRPNARPGTKKNTNAAASTASKYRGSVALVDKAAMTKTSTIVNLGTVTNDNKTLTRAAESNFKKIAQIMKDNPTTKLTLRAHNQDFKDAAKNTNAKKLGVTRANILQKLMVEQGVPANRIKVESLGNTELLIKQDPGNTRNQRISVKIN